MGRQRCLRAIHRTLESTGRRPVRRVARGAAWAALARRRMRDGRTERSDPEAIRAGLGHWRRSIGAVHCARLCGADGSTSVVPAGIGRGHRAPGSRGRRRRRRPCPELRSRRRCGARRMAAGPRTGRRCWRVRLGLRPWHGVHPSVLGRGRGRRSCCGRAGSGSGRRASLPQGTWRRPFEPPGSWPSRRA